jgi:hypothetical protein
MEPTNRDNDMNLPNSVNAEPAQVPFPKFRARLGLTLLMLGFIIFLIGAKPEIFELNRGAAIGFVQIIVMLIGLGLITWGGCLTLFAFWRNGERSLLADFGTRTCATGFVICFFTALADAFGFGTNPMPDVFLGRLQTNGLMIGMSIIGIGFLMMLRYTRE